MILNRKIDETIVIDGVVTIKVLNSAGGRVKLGIQAPQHITVVRGEVFLKGHEDGRRFQVMAK